MGDDARRAGREAAALAGGFQLAVAWIYVNHRGGLDEAEGWTLAFVFGVPAAIGLRLWLRLRRPERTAPWGMLLPLALAAVGMAGQWHATRTGAFFSTHPIFANSWGAQLCLHLLALGLVGAAAVASLRARLAGDRRAAAGEALMAAWLGVGALHAWWVGKAAIVPTCKCMAPHSHDLMEAFFVEGQRWLLGGFGLLVVPTLAVVLWWPRRTAWRAWALTGAALLGTVTVAGWFTELVVEPMAETPMPADVQLPRGDVLAHETRAMPETLFVGERTITHLGRSLGSTQQLGYRKGCEAVAARVVRGVPWHRTVSVAADGRLPFHFLRCLDAALHRKRPTAPEHVDRRWWPHVGWLFDAPVKQVRRAAPLDVLPTPLGEFTTAPPHASTEVHQPVDVLIDDGMLRVGTERIPYRSPHRRRWMVDTLDAQCGRSCLVRVHLRDDVTSAYAINLLSGVRQTMVFE